MSDPTDPTGTPERFADDARRYRLGARIATGGMGEVWRATDTVLGRQVAVKILKAEYADDATFRSRFETEARNAGALHHANVAGVFDFGQASASDGSGVPRPYLVMELVEGEPLSALLEPDRPMPADVVVDLMAQAADGIGSAHRAGIVHRDIKPANLLVTADKTVKITDFGIARAGDNVALTQTGMVMGTPQYISPEQAQGMTAGPAADVYSLGVVAYECLTGRRPFVADTAVATALAHLREPVPDLPDSVPADLAAVIKRSMSKKPEERFDDGNAFARALRNPAAAVAALGLGAEPDDGASESTQVLTGVAGASTPPPTTPPVTPRPAPAPAPTPAEDEPEDEEKKKLGALPWIVGALALVLAGLLIYLFVITGGGGDDSNDDATESATTSTTTSETTSPETATTSTSETPDTIDINADDYVGQPYDEVRQELESYGLNVDGREVTNDGDGIEGVVSNVQWSGDLVEGDTVTVEYYGAEAQPEPEPTSETSEPETQDPTSDPTSEDTSATTVPETTEP